MRQAETDSWDSKDLAALAAEADARRVRLSDNLQDLSVRMRPANLVQEVKGRAMSEVDRLTDEFVSMAQDLVQDSAAWLQTNRRLAIGGMLTAVLSAGLVWYATRRKPVPLYAAYDREDSPMTDTDDMHDEPGMAQKAAGAWSRVKDDARHLGDRAGEGYYAARSRAAELADEARERAIEAAEVAREKAREAADAARDAAEKARIAAGDAGEWARRQPQESPATVVLVALAAGALLGTLMPASGRRRD